MNTSRSFRVDRPSVVSEIIDGEAIILDLRRGSYLSIRGTGAAIWAGIEAGAPVADIAAQMAAAHGADAAAIPGAVAAFLEALIGHDLIVPGTEPHPAPLPAYGGGGAFVAPEIELYTDMEDILMLDPIHDVEAVGWPARKASDGVG